MPIPLRPTDPAPQQMPQRARRTMAPAAGPQDVAIAPGWLLSTFRRVRREPVAATPRVWDNDGWPCQPLGER